MSNRTLILYAGKYGCTEKAAFLLKLRLGEAEAVNLKYAKVPALAAYDTVILGGSIYYGTIRKEMAAFTSKNVQELSGKRLGLFICAGMTGRKRSRSFSKLIRRFCTRRHLPRKSWAMRFIRREFQHWTNGFCGWSRGKGMKLELDYR